MDRAKRRWAVWAVGLLLLLAACGQEPEVAPPTLVSSATPLTWPTFTPLPTLASTPVAVVTVVSPTATIVPTPAPTLAPITLGAEAGVPTAMVAAARALADGRPKRYRWVEGGVEADVRLVIGGRPLALWVHAVVAPFPTVVDYFDGVDGVWLGEAAGRGVPVVGPATLPRLNAHWGAAAAVLVVPDGAVVDTLWADGVWGVVPFEALEPSLKVMRVNGRSPLDPDYEPAGDPLAVPIGLAGAPAAVEQVAADWPGPWSNRDPAKLTRVAMTGPSGLSRAVADRMERYGVTHPGRHVVDLLRGADIAHLSNEMPFAPDCPPSEWATTGDTRFCSRDKYLELMTWLEIDVNEMTGNHVNDWGEGNLQHTFDLYEGAGIATFGGGRDRAAAERPWLVEHNGNRLAFVGCNTEGPSYAFAGEGYGGALPCEDWAFIEGLIGELDAAGYVVIATLQYLEHYQYDPVGPQRREFRRLAAAGAAAVSGSQGHFAQGFDFHAGGFIHFGLGNLFFDQMDLLGTRQSFIDVYTVYDNRLVSVALWTGLIEDWCCPRAMTAAERAAVLEAVFEGSGWVVR